MQGYSICLIRKLMYNMGFGGYEYLLGGYVTQKRTGDVDATEIPIITHSNYIQHKNINWSHAFSVWKALLMIYTNS